MHPLGIVGHTFVVKDSVTKELVQEVNIAHGQNHYALEQDEM